jgi:cytochrome P450
VSQAIENRPLAGAAPKRSSRLALLETVAAMDVPFVQQEIAHRPVVFVNEPGLIQEVLVARAASFEKSEFQQRVMGVAEGSETGLGNGMLTSSNATNKQQRKLLGRVFSQARMRRYVEATAALSREERDAWGEGDCVEAGAAFMRLSTRVVARTLFSWDIEPADECIFESLSLIGSLLGRSAQQRGAGWDDPTVIERVGAVVEERLMARVAERRAREPAAGDAGDVLDLLLAAQREDSEAPPGKSADYVLTDRQIRDDIITLFITGAENPRNALTWAIDLLARHPYVATQVADEIRAADAEAGNITLETLDRLPFTLQVFKETLRLYPPGYAFGRRAIEDVTVGPLALAQGTEIVISPYALHRRPALFERPNEFRPERFDPTLSAKIPAYAYLPFGAGPRSCIGGGFAMMMGHVILAVLCGRLRFEATSLDVVPPEPRMTLRPSKAVPVVVRRATEEKS